MLELIYMYNHSTEIVHQKQQQEQSCNSTLYYISTSINKSYTTYLVGPNTNCWNLTDNQNHRYESIAYY